MARRVIPVIRDQHHLLVTVLLWWVSSCCHDKERGKQTKPSSFNANLHALYSYLWLTATNAFLLAVHGCARGRKRLNHSLDHPCSSELLIPSGLAQGLFSFQRARCTGHPVSNR
eukprot:1150778-Pelagomonas_calceolata.AAC.4